jgi:hypothetical protein
MPGRRARTIRSVEPMSQDRIDELRRAGWEFKLAESTRNGGYENHFVRLTRPRPPSSAIEDVEPFQA